jgi:hypothetical protein
VMRTTLPSRSSFMVRILAALIGLIPGFQKARPP